MTTSSRYRTDIDGLRALAILSVVLFHAFPTFLPGGFVGVDVFFVISGFLITGIILKALQQGTFSFLDFYARRIRRIFPALIVVLSAVWVLGFFFLVPSELSTLSNEAYRAIFFTLNQRLSHEVGYFDISSNLKPLLHLWSLSVEEQFYLFFPILLFGASRLKKLRLLWVCLGVGGASLILYVLTFSKDPPTAFYLLPYRAWELLAGATLAVLVEEARTNPLISRVIHHPRLVQFGSFLGLLLIFGSLWLANRHGLFLLLAVLGACLTILSGPKALLNRMLLSNRPMVWIGLISYPWYLWHWPLFSLAHIIHGSLPVPLALGLLLSSLLLAWFTYRWIEKPVRARSYGLKLLPLPAAMLGLSLVFFLSHQSDGLPGRSKIGGMEEMGVRLETINSRPDRCPEDFDWPEELGVYYCQTLGEEGALPAYVIWGDSHAQRLFEGLKRMSPPPRGRWLMMGAPGCAPLTNVASDPSVFPEHCREKSRVWESYLAQHQPQAKTVVLMLYDIALETQTAAPSLPSFFYSGLDHTITELENSGRSVIFVLDTPFFPFKPENCIKRPLFGPTVKDCTLTREEADKQKEPLRAVLNRLKAKHPALGIFDAMSVVCNKDECPFRDPDGEFWYLDDNHLSGSKTSLVSKAFLEYLSESAQPTHPLRGKAGP